MRVLSSERGEGKLSSLPRLVKTKDCRITAAGHEKASAPNGLSPKRQRGPRKRWTCSVRFHLITRDRSRRLAAGRTKSPLPPLPPRRADATLDERSKGTMSKLLRGVAAGYGAKKLGGGCFSTVIVFILLWWLLGHFGIFK